MICEKCKQREATVFLTQCIGDRVAKVDLCTECAQEYGLPGGFDSVELAGLNDRARKVEEFLGNVTRHPRQAYEFVCEALEICHQWQAQRRKVQRNQTVHVSGQELLKSFRDLALAKFDKRAKAVLLGWNISKTEDFGEIIFEMVDAGLLLKTAEDSKEDFKDGYSFEEAFPDA